MPYVRIALALLALPLFAAAQVSLQSRADLAAGPMPLCLAAADLDGDGATDVAVTIYNFGGASHVAVARNLASASTPSFASLQSFAVGNGAEGLTAADFDGDGRADLVTGNASAGSISILRNVSTPGMIAFAAASHMTIGATPHRVVAADLDSDGRADLAVTDNSGQSVIVLHNASTPGSIVFTVVSRLGLPSFANPIAAADIDGDARLDLVVPVTDVHRLLIFRNVTSAGGAVSFAAPVVFVTGNAPEGACVADFDRDGNPDVVTGSTADHTAGVFRNTSTPGSISFAPRLDLPLGGSAGWEAAADLDGDGDADLIVGESTSDQVRFFENTSTPGSLAFVAAPSAAAGESVVDVIAADVAGDSLPEVIVTGQFSNLVSILYRGCGFAPAEPITFTRGTGKPVREAASWISCGGNGVMRVETSRVSSATVRLNGAIVLRPEMFDARVRVIEIEVTLIAGENALEVELNGAPGSSMTITFAR